MRSFFSLPLCSVCFAARLSVKTLCLRQILGVSLYHHNRNETVRMKCDNQPLIGEQIQKRRLQWFGHVCRMSTNRLPYKLLWREKPDHWRVQRAAPKKTWLKNIKEDLKNQRMNINVAKNTAVDHQTWKNIVNSAKYFAAPTVAYWLSGQCAPATVS